MSLILDALRRAETQRQTQTQPAYSLPSGHRTRSEASPLPQSALIATAAGAVLIAAVAVTWMAMSSDGANQESAFAPRTTQITPRAPTGQPTGTAPAPRSQGTREMASLSALARADDPVIVQPTTASATRGAGSVQVVAAQYADGDSGRESAPSARDVTPGTVVVRDLLAEDGITSGGGSITVSTPTPTPQPVQSVPASTPNPPPSAASTPNLAAAPTEFTLNMLSTSPDPASSYVYINMRRYGIGDRTSEGAVVDDISNAGAVIRYRGQRYLLKSR